MIRISATQIIYAANGYFSPRSSAVRRYGFSQPCRKMSSRPHLDRTAAEPRQDDLHEVLLAEIVEINPSIRLLYLKIVDQVRGVQFLSGQWLDVHLPGVEKVGGFTITSAPSLAISQKWPWMPLEIFKDDHVNPLRSSGTAHMELAVQKSVNNPPAAWLWRPKLEIIQSRLLVRVGGSFVWPPPAINPHSINKLVLIAGGVGINPMMSIISHLHATNAMPDEVVLLYSTRSEGGSDLSNVLFLPRLRSIANAHKSKVKLSIFVTNAEKGLSDESVRLLRRRISRDDLVDAVGKVEVRGDTVCYVCGPSKMTDEIVDVLKELKGINPDRVLCERWW